MRFLASMETTDHDKCVRSPPMRKLFPFAMRCTSTTAKSVSAEGALCSTGATLVEVVLRVLYVRVALVFPIVVLSSSDQKDMGDREKGKGRDELSPEEKFLKGVRICRECKPVLL